MGLYHSLNQLLPRSLRPVEIAEKKFLRASGHIVLSGPFKGMKYVTRAHCSALAPKIAGTYEQELFPFLDKLREARPDVFVDIGAAEGYYAVGAALHNWSPRIVAFESEESARRELASLMALNDIPLDRIDLRGICIPIELDALLASYERPAILMDVEGFEALLIDPLRIPHLARCRILLEYHDFVLRGISDEICRRMKATHKIVTIDQSTRQASDLPRVGSVVDHFPASIRRRVLSEKRPYSHHGWLWIEPLNKN